MTHDHRDGGSTQPSVCARGGCAVGMHMKNQPPHHGITTTTTTTTIFCLIHAYPLSYSIISTHHHPSRSSFDRIYFLSSSAEKAGSDTMMTTTTSTAKRPRAFFLAGALLVAAALLVTLVTVQAQGGSGGNDDELTELCSEEGYSADYSESLRYLLRLLVPTGARSKRAFCATLTCTETRSDGSIPNTTVSLH